MCFSWQYMIASIIWRMYQLLRASEKRPLFCKNEYSSPPGASSSIKYTRVSS